MPRSATGDTQPAAHASADTPARGAERALVAPVLCTSAAAVPHLTEAAQPCAGPILPSSSLAPNPISVHMRDGPLSGGSHETQSLSHADRAYNAITSHFAVVFRDTPWTTRASPALARLQTYSGASAGCTYPPAPVAGLRGVRPHRVEASTLRVSRLNLLAPAPPPPPPATSQPATAAANGMHERTQILCIRDAKPLLRIKDAADADGTGSTRCSRPKPATIACCNEERN